MPNRTSTSLNRLFALALGALPLVALADPLPADDVPVSIQPLGQITSASTVPTASVPSPRVEPMAERLVATFGELQQRHQSSTAAPVKKTSRASKPGTQAPGPFPKASQPVTYRSLGPSSKIQATTLDNVVAKTRAQGTLRRVSAKQDVLQKSEGDGHDGAVKTARAFFTTQGPLTGLQNPNDELSLKRVSTDELGYTQVRFAQSYNGIPVFASEVIAQVDKAGDLISVHGAYAPTPKRLTLKPSLSSDQAQTRARLRFQGADQVRSPQLTIFDAGNGHGKLAWQIEVDVSPVEAYTYLIDAHSAEELLTVSRIYHDRVSGSGVDLFGQTQMFNQSLWEDGGIYYLADTTKTMYQADSLPPSPATSRGVIVIGDAQNTTDSSAIQFVASAAPNGPWLADGVSAAVNLSATYDYFQSRHNRNSLDDAGTNLVGIVRVDSGLANAFFDSSTLTMYFGDADAYAGALDVVAHEMAHGVIETSVSGGLLYHGQSGALNEAFADIFGEMAEDFATGGRHDWMIGSNLSSPIRSMSDPSSLEFYPGRPYPSRFSEFVRPDDPVLNNFPNRDNDGVHFNSSIINHAFYLLVTGPNGISRQDAESIFYRTLTTKLTTRSDFIDMRFGAVQSAEELFGASSTQAAATAAAFDAVEIYESPTNATPTPVPAISGEDSTIFVYWDSAVGDYFLGRLEAGVDSPPGIQLTANPVSPRPPSVSGDGSFVAFVNAQNDLCLVPTDASEVESCLGYPGEVHSVAVAPDGETFGFVLRQTDGTILNNIAIVNGITGATETYTLVAPVADGTSNTEVLYADAMDFTSDGRYLIYDAINSLQFTDGTALELWSIYAIERSTNTTFAITTPTPGFDTGYPNVAQTSNQHLVFDVLDEEAQDNKVVAANVYTGDSAVTAVAGYYYTSPVYVGDDSAVVLTAEDAAQPTLLSLFSVPLATDRITPTGNSSLWLADAGGGSIYRRGTPATPSDVDIEVEYEVTSVEAGHTADFDLTIRNIGTTDANGVEWSISLPPNARVGSFDDGGTPECVILEERIECTFSDPMRAGGSGEKPRLRLTLLEFSDNREIVSSATAFGSEPDTNTGNNTGIAAVDESMLNIAPELVQFISDRTVTESQSVSFTIASNFFDEDGDALLYSATGLPPSLAINEDTGEIAGVPTSSEAGNTYSVTVTASDNFEGSVSDDFSISVNASPPPPPPPSTDSGGGGGGGSISLLSLVFLSIAHASALVFHRTRRIVRHILKI